MRLGWKTIVGVLAWGVGELSKPEVFAVLPEAVAKGVSVAGVILAVIGGRHAIAKLGR